MIRIYIIYYYNSLNLDNREIAINYKGNLIVESVIEYYPLEFSTLVFFTLSINLIFANISDNYELYNRCSYFISINYSSIILAINN